MIQEFLSKFRNTPIAGKKSKISAAISDVESRESYFFVQFHPCRWCRQERSVCLWDQLGLSARDLMTGFLLDLEKLKVLGKVYFLFLFLYSGLEYTLTFLTHLRFDYNASQQGKMLLFIGLLMAFFQGGLVRRVQPGKEKLIALVVGGVMLILVCYLRNLTLIVSTLCLTGTRCNHS